VRTIRRVGARLSDEIWTEDGEFYDPKTGVHRGRDEIDRIAGASGLFTLTFDISQLQNRRNWAMAAGPMVSGRPGKAPAYAGTDFIIARDGRIAALYLFSTSYPELDSAARQYEPDHASEMCAGSFVRRGCELMNYGKTV